jgi:hypothetical protein
MKRVIPISGISIVLGLLFGWLEEVLSSSNLGNFNFISAHLTFFLIALLALLILIYFSGNLFTSILSIVILVCSICAVTIYLGVGMNYELYVCFIIISTSGFITALLRYLGKKMGEKVKSNRKEKIDIAFPLIFLFVSILFAAIVVLIEQNLVLFHISKIFYSYLYFLIVCSLVFSFLSFNEISGLLIGFFSISIYFLMMRLIGNNFDFRFLFSSDRNFVIAVGIYSVLFAFSTMLTAGSGRTFVKGFVLYNKSHIDKEGAKLPEKPGKQINKNIKNNSSAQIADKGRELSPYRNENKKISENKPDKNSNQDNSKTNNSNSNLADVDK